MAYDRHGPRDYPRDERSRWRNERDEDRFRDRDYGRGRDERGFFERAGDEVASWFGDEDAERRRREDRMREEREGRYRQEYDRDWREEDRGRLFGRERDDDRFRDRDSGGERSYRPLTGDYGRGEGFFAAGGYPRGEYDLGRTFRGSNWQERAPRIREDTPRSAHFAGDRPGGFDPHYRSWRERHMNELDRDYDEYARENQARFENEFGSWRERRQAKRGLLGQVREQMEVVGNDDGHVGTIDRVAGDRIILTRSDPESGGVHHSLSCSDIDQVAGDRVVLDCSAEQAKQRWRDESRSRALFEREDQGEMGPRILDRSFEGTYRER